MRVVGLAELVAGLGVQGDDAESVRGWAIVWSFGNGVAILAVAASLALLLSWRARALDTATP